MKRLRAWLLSVGVVVAAPAFASSAGELLSCSKAQEDRKFDDGVGLCTRALNAGNLTPSDQAFAYARRGQMNRALRKYDDAIADFSQIIRLKPGFAQGYVDRASAHMDKREIDLAFADFDAAVRVEPDNADARLLRGYARLNGGLGDLALADFTAVIRLRPLAGAGYYARAGILLDKGQFDEAIQSGDQDQSRFRSRLAQPWPRLCRKGAARQRE